MATCRGMSLRMCALAVAIVGVVFLNMEAGQVQADGCDQNGLISSLSACLGVSSIPSPTSSCCDAFRYVHYTLKPADSCICQTANSKAVLSLGLTSEKLKAVISACVDASAIPLCL